MSYVKVDSIKYSANTANSFPTTYIVHNIKLWCAFDASSGVPSLGNSYSVSTIVDLAVGKYIVRPDVYTGTNTATMMLGHVIYARDNNVTAANTGFSGFVGGNAAARIGTWLPSTGFIDPPYVSVIGAYERIMK